MNGLFQGTLCRIQLSVHHLLLLLLLLLLFFLFQSEPILHALCLHDAHVIHCNINGLDNMFCQYWKIRFLFFLEIASDVKTCAGTCFLKLILPASNCSCLVFAYQYLVNFQDLCSISVVYQWLHNICRYHTINQSINLSIFFKCLFLKEIVC